MLSSARCANEKAKADTEHFDTEMPDAQAELARSMDLERLPGKLSYKTCAVLDMAAADSMAEIGRSLGGGGQYATRIAAKEVRAAVVALNAALAEGRLPAAWDVRASGGYVLVPQQSGLYAGSRHAACRRA